MQRRLPDDDNPRENEERVFGFAGTPVQSVVADL